MAAAAWLNDGIALEEFRVRKRKGGGSTGRCDLYLGLKKRRKYRHFDAEGKHCVVKLNQSSEKNLLNVDDCLARAADDASYLPRYKTASRLGFAFISFRGVKDTKKQREAFQEWAHRFGSGGVRCDAVAWFFLPNTKVDWPGAAILVQRAKRRPSK